MPKYNVPMKVRRIAQRAIDYNLSLPISQRAAYKVENGKRIAGTGMRTARRLANNNVDEPQARLMAAWFARHGESERQSEARQDKTSKAAVAWALWGGNSGRQWVNALLREIERNK